MITRMRMIIKAVTIFTIALAAFIGAAHADEDIENIPSRNDPDLEGPARNGRWLAAAVADAQAGEAIEIPEGEYDVADIRIRRDLSLIGAGGAGDVVLYSSRPTQKGLLNPRPGVSVRVENITFRDATSPDRNGAGVRHDGRDLAVVDCRFLGNENGILATGDADGAVTIARSEFIDNGHGDGYSHGVYLSSGARLLVEDSLFVGTRIGHHIKSLAAETVVTGSRLDDADGRTSYAVDASRGGAVEISGNTIIQAASSDNPAIVNYDLTRGGVPAELALTNNTIINRHRRGLLLRNDTHLEPRVEGNAIRNEAGGRLDLGDDPPAGPSALERLKAALSPRRARESESAGQGAAPSSGRSAQTPAVEDALAGTASRPPAPKELALETRPVPRGRSPEILKAPEIEPAAGALFVFRVENNSRRDADEDIVTFAQPLPPGAFTDGPVAARYGRQTLAAQVDVKARHPDGSARHAIFTVETPRLGAGAHIDAAVVAAARSAIARPSGDFGRLLADHYDLPVAIDFVRGGGAGTGPFDWNARAAALHAIRNPDTELWLDGPLVRAFRIAVEAAPHLQLRADIAVYRDGDIRTSLAFANDKTFAPGSRDLEYSVAVGSEGAPAFAAAVAHHRSSVWRRIFWTGKSPPLDVAHDYAALVLSGAVPPLDASLGIKTAVVAENLAALEAAPPLAPRLVAQYFPQGGGRADLGLTPQWTANYLVTQDPRAKRVMLANAEAAGAAPWHFRDDATGAPVRIDQRPKFWADERGLAASYAPDNPHPDVFASGDGGWTVDHAHKPDLSYVPYLVTGDRHHADLLAMQAAYAVFGRWPDLREGGVKAIDVGQVRGTAWSLRDLSNAAYALPDDDPLKGYFQATLAGNLRQMADKYARNRERRAAGQAEGYIDEEVYGAPERISPWQNDFVTFALAHVARQHSGAPREDARALLAWTANFQAGRFLTDAYDLARAPAYILAAYDAATRRPRGNWRDIARATFGASPGPLSVMDGYPDYAAGYIASGYGALALLTGETDSLGALEAFGVLARENRSHGMWRRDADGGAYRNNGFVFALVRPDGGLLSRGSFFRKREDGPRFIVSGRRNRLEGGRFDDILVGAGGKETLEGGPGDDALFGRGGADRLSAGPGADRLIGGAGDDRLEGGPGADLFAFRTDETGVDQIPDFDPAADKLAIIGVFGDSAPDLTTLVTSTPDGARIDFPGGASVVLIGVPAQALDRRHLTMVQ